MADDASWQNIERFGLLSTSALLDKWQVTGSRREEIESNYRNEIIIISNPEFGNAAIRDQKAMPPWKLKQCLPPEISVSDWYRFINQRVFFWADWTGLKILMSANEYIHKPHIVISVDSHSLLKNYQDKLFLSEINSGSTFSKKGKTKPEYRDFNTFRKIEDYHTNWIDEITILDGVPDIRPFTNWVRRYRADTKAFDGEPVPLEDLWHP